MTLVSLFCCWLLFPYIWTFLDTFRKERTFQFKSFCNQSINCLLESQYYISPIRLTSHLSGSRRIQTMACIKLALMLLKLWQWLRRWNNVRRIKIFEHLTILYISLTLIFFCHFITSFNMLYLYFFSLSSFVRC